MTPAHLEMLAERLREFRPELDDAAIARMLRAVDGRIEAALKVARKTMQNEWYNLPRIGLEQECAQVDEALRLFSPAETPAAASTPHPDPDPRFAHCRGCGVALTTSSSDQITGLCFMPGTRNCEGACRDWHNARRLPGTPALDLTFAEGWQRRIAQWLESTGTAPALDPEHGPTPGTPPPR